MLIDKEGAKRVLQSIMTIMEDIFRGTMKRFIGSEKTTRLVTNKDEKGFSYNFTPLFSQGNFSKLQQWTKKIMLGSAKKLALQVTVSN